MKKLTFLLSSILFANLSFGQNNFYPIGAKWVYQDVWSVPPPERNGTNTDVYLSEKDTTINSLNLRKIVYSRNSKFVQNYFFSISTSGVSLYYNDTLRLIYPFNIKVGDTTIVEYSSRLSDYPDPKLYTFQKIKATCTTITSQNLLNYKITSYNLKLKGGIFDRDINYNDINGLEDWSGYKQGATNIFIPGPSAITVMPDLPYKMTFNNDSLQNKNGKWGRTSNVFVNVDINKLKFKTYPNPTQNSIFIESNFNATYYQIKSLQGTLLAAGEISADSKIDVSQFTSGLYLLSLYAGNQFLTTQKIIIQK